MILTLDPSSTACGYAVFDGNRRVEAGVIRPAKKSEAEACRRAHSMGVDLRELFDEHAGDIELVVIEEPPPFKRVGSTTAQNRAFGVLMSVLIEAGVKRIETVNPSVWTGNTDKGERAKDIGRRHGIALDEDKGHDAADAIGLAEWWLAIGQHRGPKVAKKRKGRAA